MKIRINRQREVKSPLTKSSSENVTRLETSSSIYYAILFIENSLFDNQLLINNGM